MKAEREIARLTVRIDRRVASALKVECARRGVPMQAAAEEALKAWLRKGGAK
jgi:hypothetical protein